MTREQILHEALEEIANPIAAMQRRAAAEGKRLDGMGCVALSKDPGYLITLAQDALDKARKLPACLTIDDLQRESYETARDKGWHEEDDQSPSEAIRLIAVESADLLLVAQRIENRRKGMSGDAGVAPLRDTLLKCLTDEPESEYFEQLSARQVRVIAWLGLVATEVAESIEDVVAGRWETTKNEKGKPEGLGSELADIIIRVCDDAGALGINLAADLRTKLDYNRTRSHKHGGKLA